MTKAARVAIVTGAGSGIGRAVALALAQEGFSVVAAGRRKDALDATAEMAGPREMRPVACDVADQNSVRAMFAATKAAFGRLDLLFNNAGTGTPPMPMEDIPFDSGSASSTPISRVHFFARRKQSA